MSAQGETSWLELANCRGLPTELFYDEHGKTCRAVTEACANCEVIEQCLEEALQVSLRDDFGYRAGTSVVQRRRIRRDRNMDGRHSNLLVWDAEMQRYMRIR